MRACRQLLLIAILFLPLLSGCGDEVAKEANATIPEVSQSKAASVKVQQVIAQDLKEYFTLPGSLEAWQDLTLAAEIAGPIDWVGPQEGERVSAGQKILTIDSVSQKANLERAKVDAEIKQANMQRLEQLVDENLVSRQEYDNSVNACETAKQNLALAKIALNKSTVRAPVDGILDQRSIERGEYVKDGNPVALVVQVDRLKALIDVPEKDVRYLNCGEQVNVIQAQIDTGEESHRLGELVHLAYKADPVTRTYRGKIEVDNDDGQLRPGMIIRIEALRRELKDAIAIPLYAVVDLDGRKVVFVAKDGKAKLRPVKIERIIGDQAVIAEGLQQGEQIVVKGQQLLTDGTPIKLEDK